MQKNFRVKAKKLHFGFVDLQTVNCIHQTKPRKTF